MLGLKVELLAAGSFSTDMGNVSQLVPGIHPMVAVAPPDVLMHSPQFATVAASEAGVKGFMDAAKTMAMTVIDLLASPEIVRKITDEFGQKK